MKYSLPGLPVLQCVCSKSCPLRQWCHPTISSSVTTFSSCLQSFPATGSFPGSRLFTSGGQHSGASASASVLPMNFQGWFPLENWLIWSPFCPRNSQESSPAPRFKSIISWVLSLLYSLTLTSIRDYWKNHNLEYTDLCRQKYISAFLIISRLEKLYCTHHMK